LVAIYGALAEVEFTLSRPREALVFFKAGGYSMTYAISILWNGVTYRPGRTVLLAMKV
jgi:hypothetical protein